jgi:putative phage-type endonuclease
MYEFYDFLDILRKGVFESFEDFVDEDLFHNIFDTQMEMIFNQANLPVRSLKYTYYTLEERKSHIDYLVSIPQPEQRTNAWYEFRYNHITASNAWKCFGNEKSVNSIVFEKLQPLNVEKYKPSLHDSPLTWGQKFEPISVMYYEDRYNTSVLDLGCLEHSKYKFLAASPDGLVYGKNNNGRLLEIKNVVSRNITQIPKTDYWIQMQLQMEVCDLDECDFLETKFVEYDSYHDFKNSDCIDKGMIMVFVKDETIPIYEYSPLKRNTEEDIDKFTEEMRKKHNVTNTIWVKNIYWRLETFSCIFVPRNKLWFESCISKIENVWNIIMKERNSDNGPNLDKYKPTRRIKSQDESQNTIKVIKKPIIDINSEMNSQFEFL